MKEIILAFDFDGTLYPIHEYDSEETLIMLGAGTDKEKEMRDELYRSVRRGEDPLIFEKGLVKLMKGKDISLIEKTAEKLWRQSSSEMLSPVRKMAALTNTKFYVLSCGTVDIIRSFLEKAGLLDDTDGIIGKEFVNTPVPYTNFIWHIRNGHDKAEALRKIKESNPEALVIAVGDGITDGPMLKVADAAYVMEWPGAKHVDLPYPHISSYEGLLEEVLSLSGR